MTSHELFGFMSASLAADIIEYAFSEDKKLYRAAMEAVAQARRVRPIFLERQPRPIRHASMIQTLSRPALDLVADNLIRTWLLKKHAAMLTDFLNALGIKHEEGVVEDLPASVDDATLRSAVEALLAKYPPEAVAVYLHAFNEMNEAGWENLQGILDKDRRLDF